MKSLQKFQIGTDEAGYGPNLGPLAIVGSLWQAESEDPDLFQQLAAVVTPVRAETTASRMMIADSKTVHSGTHCLRNLELSVLAVLTANLGYVPENWLQLLNVFGPPAVEEEVSRQSWSKKKNLELPIKADRDAIKRLADCFVSACDQSQVRLKKVHCVPIFPDQFNREIVTFGNKATLLSNRTLNIVRALLDATSSDVLVGCDKHGGRSKYAGLIQETLTDQFVRVETESLAISQYRFVDKKREVQIRFEAKGESFLPTAFSSMFAKYIRELSMILWNDFWLLQVPGIRPTKGYQQDAKRFKREIEARQQELGISDDAIWRRS